MEFSSTIFFDTLIISYNNRLLFTALVTQHGVLLSSWPSHFPTQVTLGHRHKLAASHSPQSTATLWLNRNFLVQISFGSLSLVKIFRMSCTCLEFRWDWSMKQKALNVSMISMPLTFRCSRQEVCHPTWCLHVA